MRTIKCECCGHEQAVPAQTRKRKTDAETGERIVSTLAGEESKLRKAIKDMTGRPRTIEITVPMRQTTASEAKALVNLARYGDTRKYQRGFKSDDAYAARMDEWAKGIEQRDARTVARKHAAAFAA